MNAACEWVQNDASGMISFCDCVLQQGTSAKSRTWSCCIMGNVWLKKKQREGYGNDCWETLQSTSLPSNSATSHSDVHFLNKNTYWIPFFTEKNYHLSSPTVYYIMSQNVLKQHCFPSSIWQKQQTDRNRKYRNFCPSMFFQSIPGVTDVCILRWTFSLAGDLGLLWLAVVCVCTPGNVLHVFPSLILREFTL